MCRLVASSLVPAGFALSGRWLGQSPGDAPAFARSEVRTIDYASWLAPSYTINMIRIRFPDVESKRRALGSLAGRFPKSWATGEMIVPESAPAHCSNWNRALAPSRARRKRYLGTIDRDIYMCILYGGAASRGVGQAGVRLPVRPLCPVEGLAGASPVAIHGRRPPEMVLTLPRENRPENDGQVFKFQVVAARSELEKVVSAASAKKRTKKQLPRFWNWP